MNLAKQIGKQIAKALFDKRSAKGRRNVEVHVTEEDVAALVTLGIELALKKPVDT